MSISVTRAVDTAVTAATSGAGQAWTNTDGAVAISAWINVTATSGTPSATFRLQWSPDGGTTWLDWDTTNLQTAAITGVANATLRVGAGLATAANASRNDFVPRMVRIAYTITGGTPSVTFSTWITGTG